MQSDCAITVERTDSKIRKANAQSKSLRIGNSVALYSKAYQEKIQDLLQRNASAVAEGSVKETSYDDADLARNIASKLESLPVTKSLRITLDKVESKFCLVAMVKILLDKSLTRFEVSEDDYFLYLSPVRRTPEQIKKVIIPPVKKQLVF